MYIAGENDSICDTRLPNQVVIGYQGGNQVANKYDIAETPAELLDDLNYNIGFQRPSNKTWTRMR